MNLGAGFAIAIVLAAAPAAADPGFTVALGGGTAVTHSFVEAHLGRRFAAAPHFELYLDYSYTSTISEFPFHTAGLGMRTYLARRGRLELFQEASAGLAISQGGHFADRSIGDRILGPVLTVGIGFEAAIDRCWSVAGSVATGDPIWLRSALTVQYRF